jgi:hypothetical protein
MDIQRTVWFIGWRPPQEGCVHLNELKKVLGTYGIPFHEWGANGRKSIIELLEEINAEESVLVEQGGVITRHIACAAIDIFYDEGAYRRYLVETHQIVNDMKRIRSRNYSITEKKRRAEDPLLCAHRALSEELGIRGSLDFVRAEPIIETNLSRSFFGRRMPSIRSSCHCPRSGMIRGAISIRAKLPKRSRISSGDEIVLMRKPGIQPGFSFMYL